MPAPSWENLDHFLQLDDVGGFAVTAKISFRDENTPISLPVRGAELNVYMGYDDEYVKMGLFIVDEIELSGPPDKMIIRSRAAVQTESKSGKTSMLSQKNRTWPKDTTIESLVSKIAKEHELEYIVSESLQNIKLPQNSQSTESDITFLMRLAKRFDAICKPADGKLLFVKRGEILLAQLTYTRYQVSNWSMIRSSREANGTVIATWYEKKNAKKNEVKLGDGEPVRRLRHNYSDEKSAQAAAQSALDEAKRNEDKLSINLVGDPNLSAESRLLLSQFRDGIDGEWVIDSVTHMINKSNGFSTSFEAVKNIATESNL